MEAYSAACVSYAQQLFAFSNRELVARGHFGPAPPAPGMTFSTESSKSPGGGYVHHSQPSVTMPVKIDPEEEKRLALLRKRVAANEAKREVLETEYLSLRAHYVHESHKLRRVRSAVSGQVNLLRELVKRRGDALAMRRVKCAVARDILHALESRSAPSTSVKAENNGERNDATASDAPTASTDASDMNVDANSNTASNTPESESATPRDNKHNDNSESSPMEGVENTSNAETEKDGKADQVPIDLVDIWTLIESKLHEAELSCTEITTPEDLVYMKNALKADAAALENATETTFNGYRRTSSASNSRADSPDKEEDQEDDSKDGGGSASGAGAALTSGATKKKKSRSERAAKRGEEDGEAGTTNGANGSKEDKDNNVIPWSCRVMPRTPYGVALYLSNLSRSPELAAAFCKFYSFS